MTVFCQDIHTEEDYRKLINNRIQKDSATYSWDRVNEIVNGLENETRLDTAFQRVKRENISLFGINTSLEKRLANYKDTIVPAFKDILKNERANFEDLNVVYDSSEKLLGKQRFKKYVWGLFALVLGYLIGITL